MLDEGVLVKYEHDSFHKVKIQMKISLFQEWPCRLTKPLVWKVFSASDFHNKRLFKYVLYIFSGREDFKTKLKPHDTVMAG